MKLIMPKEVRARVRLFGALAEQDLNYFIAAKLKGEEPRRLDKPCGYNRFGEVICQMHIDLALGHYRFTDHADPLLIYQQFSDLLYIFAVAIHDDIFHGNERRWCHEWQHSIMWEGNENYLDELNLEFGNI